MAVGFGSPGGGGGADDDDGGGLRSVRPRIIGSSTAIPPIEVPAKFSGAGGAGPRDGHLWRPSGAISDGRGGLVKRPPSWAG